jgi:hypothetical protein
LKKTSLGVLKFNFSLVLLYFVGVTSVKVQKDTNPKEYDVTKTAGFREAMDDVEHGRVYHADSVDDMFKQILGCRMIQN